MANGHGGARIGAGQKKKALSERIVEGNPGKRKLTVMEFTDTADLQGKTMPPPRDYLAARQKNGKDLVTGLFRTPDRVGRKEVFENALVLY